jgi:hypothetical protein
MNMPSTDTRDQTAMLRRQVRLVVLLRAAEEAGLVPLAILRLHTFAYLSNVLAPVWDLETVEGKVLKRRGGPFYPSLQQDLDRLVGMGLVLISGLSHARDEDDRWRLEGAYRLNFHLAQKPLERLATFESERRLSAFLQELAFALSALTDRELDQAMTEDATYADPVIAVGNVVDFAEWQNKNWSANAAHHFERLMPGGIRATPGEKLHLYVRHLHARLQQAG